MINLIDFIIALFRDDDLGRAFVTDPARTLSEAGLSHVSAAQLGAVAAAVPEIGLRTGDPITSLQHAVAVPAVASGNGLLSDIPINTEANDNDTRVHDNTTELGSHNVTEVASPDFTFGDFVLGGGNHVDNGVVHTGSNSNIAYGDGSHVIQENIDHHVGAAPLAVTRDALPVHIDDTYTPPADDALPTGDGSEADVPHTAAPEFDVFQ
jgi:hypothetical protein